MDVEAQDLHFREQGWLHLPGFLARQAVAPLAAQVLAELKRQQLWAGGRSLSGRLQGVPVFQQITRLGQWITVPDLGARIVPPALHAVLRRVAHPVVLAPSAPPAQLLLSLPQREAWSLDGLDWHRDVAASKALPGVQVFVLLDDVSPQGGATLALAGSHDLKRTVRGRHEVATLLASARGGPVEVDGVGVSVLEMAGRAGDVYLMDMRLLHTPSRNAARRPRIMATMRFLAA